MRAESLAVSESKLSEHELKSEGFPSWMVAFGIISIFAYECLFLIAFGIVLHPQPFFSRSLMISLGMLHVRKTRAHWSNLSPRSQKKCLKNYEFSLFIHGTDEERPVHMRVRPDTTLFELGVRLWKQGLLPSNFFEVVSAWTRSSGFLLHRIDWADTVRQHGLGNLSRITLSVPILGGNGDEMDVDEPVPAEGSSRSRNRNKAQRMHQALAALDSGDDEPQPRKKRKRTATSARKATTSKCKPAEDDQLNGSQDEESDSEIEVVVDNSELAKGLASKTDPSANGVRKGKGKEKEKDTAGAKPRKKRRRVAVQPEKVIEPGREPSDRPNAAKEAKSPAKRKPNPIRHFFTVLTNQDAGDNSKSYRCNLGNKRSHIKTFFPEHYRMFLVWNEKDGSSPTEEELEIAHGKKEMTEQVSRKFADKVKKIQNSIEAAFEKQQAEKRASFPFCLK
ncbi:hypothetical protein C8J57DRAFT_1234806 [Mycena rebaudengoi]|nr:hypothetical protein C8J57DRAFT_1234806 [Mycena rebaudengoi]